MKFEVEPITFSQAGRMFTFAGGRLAETGFLWLQDAGGFAMLGLVLWLGNGLLNPVYETVGDSRRNRLVTPLMSMLAGVATTLYLVAFGLARLLGEMSPAELTVARAGHFLSNMEWAYEIFLAVAGLVAIVAFAGPVFADLWRMRANRIYAIAKLSFTEAVRRRVVWVFLSILILYLFPARWFFREKPEDELKSIIDVTTRGMNLLLISVGLLLASFSIPNDIKNLTIHTIVTKPVERFELVLGRFFGYLGLITMALLLMTGLGLVLINSGNVSEEAEEESMKSRVAVYGDLEFLQARKASESFTGVDVGREDTYRRYITGKSAQQAAWNFQRVPGGAGRVEPLSMEFAFDVYRTLKGEEGVGVSVSFDMQTHNWNPAREAEFTRATLGLGNVKPQDANWAKIDQIAEEYGRYVWKNWQIFDYHTSAVPVPAGLLRNAAAGEPARDNAINETGDRPLRRLQVAAKCDTPAQFIGVAKYDLYLLESEGNFSVNYFKGAVGLWFRLVVAIAISVTCSTYLTGVLSFLCALFLFIGGFFLDFITELSHGLNVGGGPMESMARLVKGNVAAAELDPTPALQAMQLFDGGYRWILRRVLNVIPDVDRYGLSEYVAQGFSISPEFLLINFVLLLGYVVPWLVAAYYLMKAREIAA